MEKNPDYLLLPPGILAALIEESRERGVRPDRLKEIATMNETLLADTRRECAATWGTPLHDIYSCAELGIVALQCPAGESMHIMSETVFVEILDETGRPCAPGTIGRVVATALQNFALPLLRYDIGDYAEVGTPCACGRNLPTLSRIMGRSRNMAMLPSGERFWPTLPAKAFAEIAPIKQLQLVQRSVEEIEVRLVIDRAPGPGEQAALAEAFTGLFGHRFRYTFVRVDAIAREHGTKYEGFICRVARP